MFILMQTADAFRNYDVIGHQFYTVDHDNSYGCAMRDLSGWWYKHCTQSNLNSPFYVNHEDFFWYGFIEKGTQSSNAEMLIKRNQ